MPAPPSPEASAKDDRVTGLHSLSHGLLGCAQLVDQGPGRGQRSGAFLKERQKRSLSWCSRVSCGLSG